MLVLLDNDHLRRTSEALRDVFPDHEFCAVGCAFSPGSNYLKETEKTTRVMGVRCVFSNAKFIITGVINQTPLHVSSLLDCVKVTMILIMVETLDLPQLDTRRLSPSPPTMAEARRSRPPQKIVHITSPTLRTQNPPPASVSPLNELTKPTRELAMFDLRFHVIVI